MDVDAQVQSPMVQPMLVADLDVAHMILVSQV
jgi:hypothetical protein